MMNQMLLHCGGESATLDELRSVPLPEETKSYKPVSHHDLVVNIERVAFDMLPNHQLKKSSHALANKGQRMFGVNCYQAPDDEEMGLSIGYRNSYDRSMAVGIAVGASIFICDNLAFTGRIAILRKHTANVINDLEMAILRVIYKAKTNFTQIAESAERMKGQPLSDDGAFRLLGLLFGRNVLQPRQLTVAKREWLKPSFEAFLPRNGWSLYNAATAALKSAPPNRILERHIQLHDAMMDTFGETEPPF